MNRTYTDSRITVARNALVLLSSSFCARFLLLGFNILLARVLGVEQFGIYAFATSYIAILSVLVEFALQQVIIRDVARNPALAGSYFSNALAIKSVLFLVAVALVPVTATVMDYSEDVELVLYLLALGLMFEAVTNCSVALFNAAQAMHYSGALQITEEFCFLLIGSISLALGGGLKSIVICRVVAQGVTQLTGVLLITKKLHIRPGRVSYSMCRKLVIQARHFFGVSSFTAAARNLDTMLLLSMQGATAVGLYAAAAKLANVAFYFSRAFTDALYPVLSRQATLRDFGSFAETYGKFMKWLMIAIVPFVAFSMAESERIMRTLYGRSFIEGSVVFQVFAWRAALGLFTQFCGTGLYALGRQRLVFIATGTSVVISLILFAVLIPSYSYTGAAFAALVALVIELFFQFPGIYRRVKPALRITFAYKPIIAGAAMAVFCAFLNFIPVIPLAALSILVYGGCLIVLGVITREELQTLFNSPLMLLQRRTARENV
jgi:O-antigen/teichoic acid export membrane protein